ncbi:MAG: DUF4331 family protein [Bryobacteraceae bacterium]
MSHHFDTKLAKEDPSLNLCDFYLFEGTPGNTVMAMTVNPDLGLSAPDTLHIEGLYAFRFDLNNDAKEDVVFKFRFADPRHSSAADDHIHLQKYWVHRAVGEAIRGDAGELLIEAETRAVHGKGKIKTYVGAAPELFAGDAFALHAFLNSFYKDKRFNGEAFLNRQNYFSRRNVSAIVLEVPSTLIGAGKVRAWATVSLFGHAPEMQVSRWGLPLMTHLFLNDPGHQEIKEKFNASIPSDDSANFSEHIGDFAERMTTYAGSIQNPSEYKKQVVARLCPTTLPYELGTKGAFDQAGFNGRALTDDVMDVMLTLASNRGLADGVKPDANRTRAEFPYFGDAYSKAEQVGVPPVPRPNRK